MKRICIQECQNFAFNLQPQSTAAPHCRSFSHLVHPGDAPQLTRILSTVILTRNNHVHGLRLRVKSACDDKYVCFDGRFRYGTQGIHCTLWTLSA
jgi:hypothetical protein